MHKNTNKPPALPLPGQRLGPSGLVGRFIINCFPNIWNFILGCIWIIWNVALQSKCWSKFWTKICLFIRYFYYLFLDHASDLCLTFLMIRNYCILIHRKLTLWYLESITIYYMVPIKLTTENKSNMKQNQDIVRKKSGIQSSLHKWVVNTRSIWFLYNVSWSIGSACHWGW